MPLHASSTELTTSATDVVLVIECIVIVAWLRSTTSTDRWRTRLWCWVFVLLAISSLLGALAHGLEMRDPIRAALWKPLYLSLGILVALVIVGAVSDWRGRAVAKPLVPWSAALGVAFFGLTEFLGEAFIVLVVYEAAALVGALAIYAFLAATRRLKGAAVVALAILLSLIAAGVQASSASVRFVAPFDHNGVFHLLQILGTATLALGLQLGMKPGQR